MASSSLRYKRRAVNQPVQIGERFRCGKWNKWHALFRCSCGTEFVAIAADIPSGRIKSCGCILRCEGNDVPNGSDHPLYQTWKHIVNRCENPECKSYHDYGGRGIRICDRWRNSFACFIADIGVRPSPGHELDRINNDGNYEPSNVRWSTRIDQARNKRTTVRLANGLPVRSVENIAAVPITTVIDRLRRGWTEFDAIHRPSRFAK